MQNNCNNFQFVAMLLQSHNPFQRKKVVDEDIFYFTSSLFMFRFCFLAPYDYVMYKYFPFDSNPVSDFFVLL